MVISFGDTRGSVNCMSKVAVEPALMVGVVAQSPWKILSGGLFRFFKLTVVPFRLTLVSC